MSPMKTLSYRVQFLTPAFLGNAEQSGQWRTPPFKALLRQWWRVAYAADRRFEVNLAEMRREEGRLFGVASDSESSSRKSQVRIRLDRWDGGKLENWTSLPTVAHPEVKFAVGSDLYLGYGPLTLPKGAKQAVIKANAAIQAGDSAILSLAVPITHRDTDLTRLLEDNAPRLERALWLMDRYGTLGGRSRNGWGSFTLLPLPPGEGRGEGTPPAGTPPLRDWKQALGLDWPHALGQDNRPLIWQTRPCADWKELMRELAIIKIGLRTQFKFPNSPPPHPQPLERHWLSYPITRHSTKAWKSTFRLPNSLRFKVRALPDGKLAGVIFHVPCAPPKEFSPDTHAIRETWQRAHSLLDECTQRSNQRTYVSIADTARRNQLKPQLDAITLQRVQE